MNLLGQHHGIEISCHNDDDGGFVCAADVGDLTIVGSTITEVENGIDGVRKAMDQIERVTKALRDYYKATDVSIEMDTMDCSITIYVFQSEELRKAFNPDENEDDPPNWSAYDCE